MMTNPSIAHRGVSQAHLTLELAVLGAIFVAATVLLLYVIYPAVGWPASAPTPARSVLLALAIVVLVKSHEGSLASIGLARPRAIWLTVLLALVFIGLKLFAIQPAGDAIKTVFSVPPSDLSFFDHLYGNLPAYLGWLATAWIAAGFAEEVIFRGYLMGRIAGLLGNSKTAWAVAIFAQALLFGLLHYYQGIGGILAVGFGALFSGAFYVLVKRNLWVLILAHGAWDSLGMTLIYLNGAPSTS